MNGENGIHLVKATNHTKPFGEVYIELASYDDLQRAKTFLEKNLGTQYIEVFELSFDEFRSIINEQRGVQDESQQNSECRNNVSGRNSKKRKCQLDCDIVDAPALPSDNSIACKHWRRQHNSCEVLTTIFEPKLLPSITELLPWKTQAASVIVEQ